MVPPWAADRRDGFANRYRRKNVHNSTIFFRKKQIVVACNVPPLDWDVHKAEVWGKRNFSTKK